MPFPGKHLIFMLIGSSLKKKNKQKQHAKMTAVPDMAKKTHGEV